MSVINSGEQRFFLMGVERPAGAFRPLGESLIKGIIRRVEPILILQKVQGNIELRTRAQRRGPQQFRPIFMS